MEKRSAKASDYIPGIVIAAIGIAINVFLFLKQRNRISALLAEYQNDYNSSLTNPAMKYYADWNQIRYQISRYVLWFIIFCAAVYLLQMILPKIRLISVLIPLADLALWGITLWKQRGMENRDAKWMLISILLSVLVFLLVWWAVFSKKTLFAVLAFLAALGYCAAALIFHGYDTKAAEELVIGNSAGNALLLMIMMITDRIVYGEPRRKKRKNFENPERSRGFEVSEPSRGSRVDVEPAAAFEPSPAMPPSRSLSVPVGSAADTGFFSLQDYVIDEKLRPFGSTKVFKIYDLSGNMTGLIREEASGGAKAARAFLGKGVSGLQAVTYQVLDMSERLQFSVAKKGGIGTASIFDSEGRMIAELVKGVLKDETGRKLGSIKNNLSLKAKLNVLDPEGKELALISEKWNGVMKEVFSTADKYFVSMAPEISREQKILALGSALIYEMILGNL